MKVTKLSEKALLVKLTRRMANLTKRDAMLTQQVRMQENDNSIDVLMKLFSNKASDIYDVKQAYSEVYQYHKNHTLPYTDAGPRILPNALYFEYTQEMKHLIAKVEKKLANIIPNYDRLVQEDMMYRNASITKTARASVSDYPTAEQFAQSMSIDLRFQPLPDASHFLFDISDEDKQAFERSEAEMSALAQADTVNRMLKPLTALIDRLGEYKGEKGERWRNTIITNVTDGCQMARKLAINPTPELLDTITQLEKAVSDALHDVEIIKGSADKRDEARAKLAEVADKMSMFG